MITRTDKRHFGLQAQTPNNKTAIESLLEMIDTDGDYVIRKVFHEGEDALEITGRDRHEAVAQLDASDLPLEVVATINYECEPFRVDIVK